MSTTFAQLGVPDFICRALERRGITEPFEIQAATVTDLLAGRDVCGRAPTGAGKTLAFGIPLIATTERAEPRRPRALVLAPTRELADQICTELRSFSGRLRVDVVYGGVGYGKQVAALNRGVDVLVACPGRLEDLIGDGKVDLGAVRTVVLDEADRMADMGFVPAVRRLLDRTPSDRRTVLFSATLDGDVAVLTRDYQRDPARHEVGESTPDVRSATHRFWTTERTERNPVAAAVIESAWPSIVFTRTRHGADRLARQLSKLGLETAPIHGGRSQSQRTRALDDFASGRVHALIATDVAARGIHVDGVASVIHYDPPEDHKAYVHRSGRTARAGATGLVVSLVQPEQVTDLRKMQRRIGLDEPFTAPDIEVADRSGRDGHDRRIEQRGGEASRHGGRRDEPGSRRRDDRPSHERGRRRSGDHDRRIESTDRDEPGSRRRDDRSAGSERREGGRSDRSRGGRGQGGSRGSGRQGGDRRRAAGAGAKRNGNGGGDDRSSSGRRRARADDRSA